MSINQPTSFNISESRSVETPTISVSSGPGGGFMDVWEESRETQLQKLLKNGYAGNYSQSLSTAIVDTTSFNIGFPQSEESLDPSETGAEVGYTFLGTRASGTVLVSPDPEADNPQAYRLEGITLHTTDGVNQFTATADPTTGEYELPLSDGGEYEIEARHPALEPVTTTISPADGESVPDTNILLPLDAGGGGSAVGLVRRRIG